METGPNSLPRRPYFWRLSGNKRRYELHAYVIASFVRKDEAVRNGYQTGQLGMTNHTIFPCLDYPDSASRSCSSLEGAKGGYIAPKTASPMLATSISCVPSSGLCDQEIRVSVYVLVNPTSALSPSGDFLVVAARTDPFQSGIPRFSFLMVTIAPGNTAQ